MRSVRDHHERDPDDAVGCADHLVRPLGDARDAGHDPPEPDAHGQRGQPRAPPGEVGPLVREPRPPGRVLNLCLAQVLRDRMRRFGELAQLARHQVGDLLADVDGVVADPLDAAGDHEHPQTILPLVRGVAQRQDVVDRLPVRPVDQVVEPVQRLGLLHVAVGERVERDPDHLLGADAHVLERALEAVVARRPGRPSASSASPR